MAKIPEHIRRGRQFKTTPDITFPPIGKISAPNFKERLLSRFFVRLHMTLMLGAVMISGIGANKLLLDSVYRRACVGHWIRLGGAILLPGGDKSGGGFLSLPIEQA